MIKKLTPLRIVVLYISAFILWIVGTDILVTNIPMSDDVRMKISIAKGIISILVSPFFLYWIILKYTLQRKQLEETPLFLLQLGSRSSNEDFFESLARYLAQSLGMDFVCIERLLGDGLLARTVTIFRDGKFEDNMEHALRDTACVDVVGKSFCCFPRDVRGLFPKDAVLQNMMAVSYVGTTLWSSDGKPIGLISVVGRKPLLDAGLAESVLELVAISAARELERRESEEALRQSENFLKEAQMVAGLGSYVLDISTSKWKSSVILNGIFGIDEKFDRSVDGWASLIHPDDRQMMVDYFTREVVGKHQFFDKEYRIIRHNDGAERWVHGLGRLQLNAKGQPVTMIGTIQDITRRKETDEKVKQSEAKYRNLFESSRDGIFIIDLDGNFIDANTTAYTRLGYTKEEMLALHISKLDHPQFAPQVPDRMKQINEHGFAVFESAHLRKDGTAMPVEVNSRLMEYEGRTVYFSMIRDITERKNAEREIEDARLKIKILSGILPICSSCKKIRDDQGHWSQLETYVSKHSEAEFSHGICPECAKKLYGQYYDKLFPKDQ